jgi:hypothetical protein
MTRPFSVVLAALEVALAISFLLSLVSRGEQNSILGESDGNGAAQVRYLRGFSRSAPRGIRESSRKLQVGPVVEFSQAFETELTDPRRAELSAGSPDLLLDNISNEGEAAGIHVALMSGAGQASQQLLPIERLPGAIALDHLKTLGDGPLIGGEAVSARGALAAPADGAVRDAARLEGLGGGVAAGTGHSLECSGR